jgi:hypothetical protein
MAIAYDTMTKRTVMYGGYSNASPAVDTWEWDGAAGTWTDRKATPPSVFDQFAFTYDTTRGTLFVFGGESYPNGGPSADLWEWNGLGGTWAMRLPKTAPAAQPPAQRNAAAAYDPVRKRIIIHGTPDLPGATVQTWEWDPDGDAWTNRTLLYVPSTASGSAFAWDVARNKGVFFGGETGREVWEVTLGWQKVQQFGGQKWPAPRQFASMVYDTARGRVLLFGGRVMESATPVDPIDSPPPQQGSDFNDLWEWDGDQQLWTQLEADASFPRPPGRESAGLAWDSTRSCLVLFGGGTNGDLRDVWEWNRRP